MQVRVIKVAKILAMMLASLAWTAGVHAQSPASVLCEPASHELDAVRAAPQQHRVLFEDDHVRVLEIVLPPLSQEPVHIHALPSVITGDTGGAAGARFLYETFAFEGGRFVRTGSQEISPTPGQRTVWAAPEGPHAIANIGPVPVRFQRIEIKPEACAARAGAVKPPGPGQTP